MYVHTSVSTNVHVMFVTLLSVQLFITGIVAGDRSFDCPNDCPLNLYEPICSRGISYSSLCALKQQICNGKLDEQIYEDIEPCSKFSKDEDMKDAVAIDQNGVILRSLFLGSDVNKDNDNNNSEDKSSISKKN